MAEDKSEIRLFALALLLAFGLGCGIISCTWYVEGMLPEKMGARSMCWDVAQRSYQRCK